MKGIKILTLNESLFVFYLKPISIGQSLCSQYSTRLEMCFCFRSFYIVLITYEPTINVVLILVHFGLNHLENFVYRNKLYFLTQFDIFYSFYC